MRKALGITYGVEDKPPLGVNVLSGLQHVGLTSIYLIFPTLVVQAAGGSADVAAAVVSMALVALAIGAILQAIPMGPVGSGYLCKPDTSVLYFVPSQIAAKHAGLAAVFGMTIAAGLFEVALARTLARMRALFPPEIAGLVVLLAGVSTGMVGLRTALGGAGNANVPSMNDLGIALITLAIMVGLNVWGRGALRMFCVLIGMTAGYALTWVLGVPGAPGAASAAGLATGPWFALPDIGHLGWSFDSTLMLPFGVAACGSMT